MKNGAAYGWVAVRLRSCGKSICSRRVRAIAEHEPALVLHGHAHHGTFSGLIGQVPVYNVSVPVIGRDFWLFEPDVSARSRAPIH